jgi:hypothetical protein
MWNSFISGTNEGVGCVLRIFGMLDRRRDLGSDSCPRVPVDVTRKQAVSPKKREA